MGKKYCIAFGCLNKDSDPDLTLFTLPKDKERRHEWLTAINREDLIDKDFKYKSHHVCSSHFKESEFKILKHLKSDAVPERFIPDQPPQDNTSHSHLHKSTQTRPEIQSNNIKKNTITDADVQTEPTLSLEKKTQPSVVLPADTPRKRKLTNDFKTSKQKCLRLSLEIKKIEKELDSRNTSVTSDDPDDEIGERLHKLVESQNKLKNKYKGNRYNSEYKVFALNMHYSSPHAYRCLQTVLKLPSKSTLSKFKINIPPKFDTRVLDSLELKLKSLPENAKQCMICVDEMTLKRHLYYDTKTDEVIGFHNINGKITPEIASNAYVIMLQGIFFKWKQPLAYALLASTKNYEELELWINEVLSKLSSIGINVRAISSYQGSNFDKFAKEIKRITVNKPFFIFNDMKIFYIFDVPHLVKCIRNDLMTSDFYHDGKKISWDYIKQLFDDQKEKNLRLIPKVSESHINPNNFQKMRVKYAVQILSRTVSAALDTYIDLGKMSEDARPTANFIQLINDLFDILNSSKKKCSNKFQAAFRNTKDQEKVLSDAQLMFANIKCVNRKTGKNNTGHIKSFVNFRISIQSIKMLFHDLKKEDIQSLFTRRLNQDGLGILFSLIRQQGGSCTEPTPIQFQRAFSKLFVSNMIKSSPFANCEEDFCDVLLKAEDVITFSTRSQPEIPQTSAVSLDGETDYRMDLPEKNAITYVSGYLLYKSVGKHKCDNMDETLKLVAGFDSATNFYTKYKALNKKSGFYGCLKMPPQHFIQYVQRLETAFVENFDTVIQKNPGKQLYELLISIHPQTPCTCFPVNYVVKLFIRFRIYTAIKLNNRQLRDDKKGIEKCVKVRHL